MSDMQTFPETVDEFMEQYKIVDTEQVYTNGIELVPIFRMKQWFEHLDRKEKWIHRADMDYKDENGVFHWHGMCGECGFIHDFLDGYVTQYNFCPNCGAYMRKENRNEL